MYFEDTNFTSNYNNQFLFFILTLIIHIFLNHKVNYYEFLKIISIIFIGHT